MKQVSADAIERALAHQDPAPVGRKYARGAFWLDRVEIAQGWADNRERFEAGGKVSEQRQSAVS
jgi:hypothetical protein